MRRVGKSTLLLQIQDEINDYHLLNKYITDRMVSNKEYYIFLDEVQEVDNFEKVVNSLNSKGDAEVFITGSNSKIVEIQHYLIDNVGQVFSAGTITKYLKNEGRKLSKENIYNYIEVAKNTTLYMECLGIISKARN